MKMKLFLPVLSFFIVFAFIQCDGDDDTGDKVTNPDEAAVVSVDRFSDDAGTLMLRGANPDLPGPGEPIDMDQAPFITQSLGPEGQEVQYYNFDVQPLAPAPIYVLFKEGETAPVEGQLNIIDVIPGDAGYSDFWQVYKVTVPSGYKANTVASFEEILNKGYEVEATNQLVNCPVVPKGSSAKKSYGENTTAYDRGWYKGKVVYYFTFSEKELATTSQGLTPTSPIYVTFNVNPDEMDPNSGPASGFVTEEGTSQTHNVVATVPDDVAYSPLWQVKIYDNADFENVTGLSSAQSATILVDNGGYVNCPLVYEAPPN
jgi:hypothetical protein